MLLILFLLFGVGLGRLGAAETPALRDFKWEPGANSLSFTIGFSGVPTPRAHDELIQNHYYFIDFYGLSGPAEPADFDIPSPLVKHVKRFYFPAQKVLRFIFYPPANGDARFVVIARGGNCTVTITPIIPRALGEAANVAVTAGGKPRKLVVIDPGHGGRLSDPISSPGATTSRNIGGHIWYEKDITLEIGKYLDGYIKQAPNMESVMTRRDDRFVSLEDRITQAKNSKGDLFLSIHLNATDTRAKTPRGFEIYYLGDGTKETNRELAALENDEHLPLAGQMSGTSNVELRDFMRVLANEAFQQRQAESRELAGVINNVFQQTGPFHLYNRGVRTAGFRVLLNFTMPAVLAECGFLDNPSDAAQLVQPAVQQQIAALLFNGINRYFARMDPEFEPHYAPSTPAPQLTPPASTQQVAAAQPATAGKTAVKAATATDKKARTTSSKGGFRRFFKK